MGIQINGQTDSISAIDGSLTFSTSSVQQVADINATGIITAASANFTGNVSIGGTLTYQDVTNIDSVGIITARAGIELADNIKIKLGTSDDLQIYHDGNNSFITDTGTGRLTISTSQLQLTNAADSEVMIKATQDGAVEFYYDNVKKFETHADGLHIGDGGNLDMPHDSSKIVMGASDDLQIYHDGNNSFIKDAGTGRLSIVTSQLQVTNAADSEVMIKATQDGAVELYHDNSKKFHTYSGGCSVFGNFNLEDNDRIRIGHSSDLQIYHNGSHSFIENSTGELLIRAKAGENSINCNPDGSIEIFHDNNKKLETNTNGIRVTGRVEINSSYGRIEYNSIANTFEFFTNNNKVAEFLSGGHFVPGTNNTYDLGSSSYRWRNIYTNDLNLSNEGSTNDVDGTWGNYTIQEGENDLFLINKRNGKKYKFNLTEVN